MGDEITMRAGDVIKKVAKASEEGWLEGELRGKRGIFPANFVKVLWVDRALWCNCTVSLCTCVHVTICLLFFSLQEVPVYLIGDSKREPRSIRKCTMLSLNSEHSYFLRCSNLKMQKAKSSCEHTLTKNKRRVHQAKKKVIQYFTKYYLKNVMKPQWSHLLYHFVGRWYHLLDIVDISIWNDYI